MKKIAIFSDIHGNLQALESILKDIDNDKFDEVICLGDIIGFGPNSKECLDLIMDSTIKMVKGNHEIYQLNESIFENLSSIDQKHHNYVKKSLNEEEINFIDKLPMSREELIEGSLFTFCHFLLNESKDYFQSLEILSDDRIFESAKEYESDYMFVGHSHDDFQISNGSLLTCPGSCGCRKNDETFYTIVEVNGRSVKITKKEVKYDRKMFEKAVKEKDYPNREAIAKDFFGIDLSKK